MILTAVLFIGVIGAFFGVIAAAARYTANRRLRRDVDRRLDEMAEDQLGPLVSAWLDDLGHDPNRSEIRRFATAAKERPPAKVRHNGRTTDRG